MAISSNTERKVGIIAAYLSMAVGVIAAFVYTPFMFEHLGGSPEEATVEYGLSSFVTSISSWLGVLNTAVASCYVRFATIEKNKNGEDGLKKVNGVFLTMFLSLAFLSAIAGAIIFALLKFNVISLALYTDTQKQMIYQLFLIAIASIFLSISATILSSFIAYNQKYIWLRGLALLGSIAILIVDYQLVALGKNVVILNAVALIFTIVTTLLNIFFCFKSLHMSFSFKRDEEAKQLFKSIVSFCTFILINAIVDQIESNIDKTILGFMSGPKSVTIYNLGLTFLNYVFTAAYSFSNVFGPKINQLVVEHNEEEIGRLFLKTTEIEYVIIFLIVGGFASCGYDFTLAWIGPDKIESFWVAITLMVLDSEYLAQNIYIEIQRAKNLIRFRAVDYIIGAVLNIVISIVCVYFMPAEDAIYGCLIGTVVTTLGTKWIAMGIYNQKKVGLPVNKAVVRYIFFFLVTSCAVGATFLISKYALPTSFGWKWTATIVKGSIFVVFFLPGVYLLDHQAINQYLKNKFARKSN